MIPGINQWTFPAEMPADTALATASRAGFGAFEICVGASGPVPLDVTEKQCTQLRDQAERLGLSLPSVGCGMGWEFPVSSPDAAVRARGREVIERSLQVAQWLGADAVLVVPGIVTPEVPYDVALEHALESVQSLVAAAERLQVAIAVENVWNRFLLSPVEMRDFIDQCESEYVGAYFDTGNILAYGYPEQWIRILGRRIRAVHAKDFKTSVGTLSGFCMLMEGDVDWPTVRQAFRDVGFDGALTAEAGSYTHSLDLSLRHLVAGLEAIIAL